MPAESKLQKTIATYLRSKGCVVMKMPAGYQAIPVGFPDLLVLAPSGRWACLEIKASETAPFQPLQLPWIEKLSEMGYSCAIYPQNWSKVKIELDKLI